MRDLIVDLPVSCVVRIVSLSSCRLGFSHSDQRKVAKAPPSKVLPSHLPLPDCWKWSLQGPSLMVLCLADPFDAGSSVMFWPWPVHATDQSAYVAGWGGGQPRSSFPMLWIHLVFFFRIRRDNLGISLQSMTKWGSTAVQWQKVVRLSCFQ